MDFAKFDSVAASEKGAPLHVLHPATHDPLYDDGVACRVIVLGAEGDTARALAREAMRKTVSDAENAPDDEKEKTVADLHNELVKRAIPLITGFEAIHRGEEPATAADAEWFLNLNRFKGEENDMSFVAQVLRFHGDRGKYLGND